MRGVLALVALGAAVALAACGGGEDTPTASADRTVEIQMVDTEFRPDKVAVDRGDTVRFVFVNRGKLPHDAFVGDAEAQVAHGREMEADADHGHGGAGDDAITVEPGDRGELVHTFDEAGTVEIGCHQPGHYDGGMKVIVTVS
jgi:uncharacterized cupredoxin-like copper-binding protein